MASEFNVERITKEYQAVFDKLWTVVNENIDSTDELVLTLATGVVHRAFVHAWKESGEYNGKPFKKPEQFDEGMKLMDSMIDVMLQSFLAGMNIADKKP